ncbi:MAG: non-hydrolyzing UDP-N-acetylglucosamine 2-epimerase [Aristaeellaceae bacterium]
MKKVMSVFGTRPEAIKMAPLVKQLEQTEGLQSIVCVTAQHRQMLDQVLRQFRIVPDYDLNLMKAGQTLTTITTGVLEGLSEVLAQARPDMVLVHGDTTTSMAAALAAFYQQIPVGHVEAGLRSFDAYSPYPEEMNRCITGCIATLHFAPTERNRQNLNREGITRNIHVVGNTVIDALHQMVHDDYVFDSEEVRSLPLSEGRWVVLTAHRRENLGAPLQHICRAVLRLTEAVPDLHVVYPMHMNPAVRETVRGILGHAERVHLIEPLEVEDMHNLMKRSYMVMTDSGGLQEEAPALGKPVIVLRTETERPEVVEAGKAILAGVEEEAIFQAGYALLTDAQRYHAMNRAVNPYGDGHTSEKIAAIIRRYFDEQAAKEMEA